MYDTVFLFLALGLVASVKFFVSELRKAQVDDLLCLCLFYEPVASYAPT
jgi:hypothetical protein